MRNNMPGFQLLSGTRGGTARTIFRVSNLPAHTRDFKDATRDCDEPFQCRDEPDVVGWTARSKAPILAEPKMKWSRTTFRIPPTYSLPDGLLLVSATSAGHTFTMKWLKRTAIVLAAWTIAASLDIFLNRIQEQLSGKPMPLLDLAGYALTFHSFWALWTIPIVLFTLFVQTRSPALWVTIAAHIGGAAVVFIANAAWWIFFQFQIHEHFKDVDALNVAREQVFQTAACYTIIAGASIATRHYRRLIAARLQEAEYRRTLAQTQLQALKLQLQPHFLFNALNSVSALLREDPDAADDVIADLCALLRLSLDSKDTQEVTVAQELEALELYLNIQRVRYQDWLTLHLTVAPETRLAIMPHLLLQPLVENAIHHGIARRSGPGTLAVDVSRQDSNLRLSVRDDGPGCSGENVRDGTGLSTTKARLNTLYGNAHRVQIASSPEGFTIVINVPFRTIASEKPC
jgi:signal transduction histidine kinase